MPLLAALVWLFRGVTAIYALIKGTKFIKWIIFGLFTYMGGLIGRLFSLLGITLVANKFATPALSGFITGPLLGLPSEWQAFIGMTKLDQAITIILSALAIRVIDQVRVKRRRDSWQVPL